MRGDCVLEGAIVESVGRELGQGRVHLVLDHQPNGLHSQLDQPLEEAPRETSTGGREGGREGEVGGRERGGRGGREGEGGGREAVNHVHVLAGKSSQDTAG